MAETSSLILKVDSRDVKNAKNDLDNLSSSAGKTEKSVINLANSFKALATGAVVAETIKLADAYNNMEGRLKLVTTSLQNLKSVQNELFNISQKSRTSLESTSDLYFRLAKSTESLGIGQERLLKVTETISKTLAISGSSAESANAALIQLGQGFASGTLRGEELNSVLEQAPALAEAIAKGMGKTVGELRALGAAGKLTADEVFKALENQRVAVEEQFGNMPKTIGQAFTTLQNEIMRFVGETDDAINGSGGVVSIIEGMIDTIHNSKGAFSVAADSIADTFSLVGEVLTDVAKQTNEFVAWFSKIIGTASDNAVNNFGFFDYFALGMQTAISGVQMLYDGLRKLINYAKMAWAYLKGDKEQLALTKEASAILDKSLDSRFDNIIESYKKIARSKKEIANIPPVFETGGIVKGGATSETAEQKKARENAEKEAKKIQEDIAEAKLDAMRDNADREAEEAIGIYQAKLDAEQKYYDDMAQMALDEYTAQEQAKQDSYDRQSQMALAFYDMTLSDKEKINSDMLALYEANEGLFNDEQMQTFFTKWQESIDGIKGGYDDISSMVDNLKLGDDFSESFTGTAKAIANASKAIKNFAKISDDVAKAKKEINSSKNLTEEQKSIELKKLENKEMEAQIGAYANLAGAASMFFEEGSKGAEAMGVAQSALAMIQAVSGIAEQAKLPFPANIAAMAATAATVFGFMSKAGIMGGGGGGGGVDASLQTSIDTAKFESEQANFIVDRLDRQIELLESIDQSGSAARSKVSLASATFESDVAKIWADMIGTSHRASTFIRDKNINVTGDKLTDVQSVISKLESWDTGLRPEDWEWLDMTRGTVLEYRSDLEDAVTSFATNLSDVKDTVKDSSDSFKEVYDSLSGTDFYKMKDLQKAYDELGNSIVGNSKDSMLSYISIAINEMEKFGEEYVATAKSILNEGTIDQQVAKLKELSEAFGVTFNNSTEQALNFLDSIELVAEAMSNSEENIKSFIDGLKTEDQLAKDMANSLGVSLATNAKELYDLGILLSGGVGGLTDAELELLNANKDLIVSNMELANNTEKQDDLIKSLNDELTTYNKNLSSLESTFKSLSDMVDNLRGSSKSADEIIGDFYSNLNDARLAFNAKDYEAYAKAVTMMSKASSTFLDTKNFQTREEMQFAQYLAANSMEDLGALTKTEIDYLSEIAKNTKMQVDELSKVVDNNTDMLSVLNASLQALLKIEGKITEQWVVDKATNTQMWTSTGGAVATGNIGAAPSDIIVTDILGDRYSVQDMANYVDAQIAAGNKSAVIDEAASRGISVDSLNAVISGVAPTVTGFTQEMISWVNQKVAEGDLLSIYNEAIKRGITSQSLEFAMGWERGISNKWVREYNATTGSRLPEFRSGGYTGDYGINQIAGIVHGKEYVVNAQTTRDLGLNNSAGVFQDLLKEIRDLKALTTTVAASSVKSLSTQRAMLGEMTA